MRAEFDRRQAKRARKEQCQVFQRFPVVRPKVPEKVEAGITNHNNFQDGQDRENEGLHFMTAT